MRVCIRASANHPSNPGSLGLDALHQLTMLWMRQDLDMWWSSNKLAATPAPTWHHLRQWSGQASAEWQAEAQVEASNLRYAKYTWVSKLENSLAWEQKQSYQGMSHQPNLDHWDNCCAGGQLLPVPLCISRGEIDPVTLKKHPPEHKRSYLWRCQMHAGHLPKQHDGLNHASPCVTVTHPMVNYGQVLEFTWNMVVSNGIGVRVWFWRQTMTNHWLAIVIQPLLKDQCLFCN